MPVNTENSVQSFVTDCVNNPVALRNYANLIYSRMARSPSRNALKLLENYVDKCVVCGACLGQLECAQCRVMLDQFIMRTRQIFSQAKDKGFYCSQTGQHSLTKEATSLRTDL